MRARLGRFLRAIVDACGRRAASRRRSGRRASRSAFAEALDPRRLLASVTIGSPGPITALTIGDDGSFQVRHAEFQNGQVFPNQRAPGDAGIFIRLDGHVVGLDLAGRGRATAAGETRSVGLHPISLEASADGLAATLVADNATDPATRETPFRLTQVTTYRPGDEFFRVENLLRNTGDAPIVVDVFAAADIYLADNDFGVGYRDPATGAVGGMDANGDWRIFVQPITSGGRLAPTAFEEDRFRAIWQAIGSGRHFDNTIMQPSGRPPYLGDPSYKDNGAGLEWAGVTIAPGEEARIAYYWSFGTIASVPDDPELLSAAGSTIDAVAGREFSAPAATFTTSVSAADPADYAATIDWIDGSAPTAGQVVRPAGSAGFRVLGTHAYAQAGDRPFRVTIVGPGGASAIAEGLARVSSPPTDPPPTDPPPTDPPPTDPPPTDPPPANLPPPTSDDDPAGPVVFVLGGLDPASDLGMSDSDGITSLSRPAFRGSATPGSTVRLFAARAGAPEAPQPLGTALAGADGAWTMSLATPLSDGAYAITASASLEGATASASLMEDGSLLVVDTAGPRVEGLSVAPRSGRMGLSIRDDLSGLDLASLADPANYRFLRDVRPRPQVFALGVSVSPAATPNGPAAVALTTPRRIGHGRRYVLAAASGGLRDVAGNPLDGEFSGDFPAGDGRPGGPFRVNILTDGLKVLPFRPASTAATAFARPRLAPRHGPGLAGSDAR